MGKSRILSSGIGKPLNSVKKIMRSYEDIPANAFVKRLEGSQSEKFQHGSNVNGGSSSFSVWLSNYLVLIFYMPNEVNNGEEDSKYRQLAFVYYDSEQKPSVNLFHETYYAWLCVQSNAHRVCTISSDGSNSGLQYSSKLKFTTYLYNEYGETTVELNSEYVTAESLGYSSINIVSGEYHDNWVYAIGKDADGNAYLIKLFISSDGVTCETVTEEPLEEVPTNEMSYLDDIDWIYDRGLNKTYDISTNTFHKGHIYISWVYLKCGRATINFCDPTTPPYIYRVITDGYQYFVTVNLNEGTYENVKYTVIKDGETMSTTYPKYAADIRRNSNNPNKLECIISGKTNSSSGDTYLAESYDGLTFYTTHLIENSYLYWGEIQGASPRNDSFVYLQDVSTYSHVSGTFTEYIYEHIEPATEETDVIYGLTGQCIRANEYGIVYALNIPEAAYTTYGLPETLVTEIKDDTVTEIKEEVQNG